MTGMYNYKIAIVSHSEALANEILSAGRNVLLCRNKENTLYDIPTMKKHTYPMIMQAYFLMILMSWNIFRIKAYIKFSTVGLMTML